MATASADRSPASSRYCGHRDKRKQGENTAVAAGSDATKGSGSLASVCDQLGQGLDGGERWIAQLLLATRDVRSPAGLICRFRLSAISGGGIAQQLWAREWGGGSPRAVQESSSATAADEVTTWTPRRLARASRRRSPLHRSSRLASAVPGFCPAPLRVLFGPLVVRRLHTTGT